MSRDGAPKPEHVALARAMFSACEDPNSGRAYDLYFTGKFFDSCDDAAETQERISDFVPGIAQAIADAEERGREAGIREASGAVNDYASNLSKGGDPDCYPWAHAARLALALLDVKP